MYTKIGNGPIVLITQFHKCLLSLISLDILNECFTMIITMNLM